MRSLRFPAVRQIFWKESIDNSQDRENSSWLMCLGLLLVAFVVQVEGEIDGRALVRDIKGKESRVTFEARCGL